MRIHHLIAAGLLLAMPAAAGAQTAMPPMAGMMSPEMTAAMQKMNAAMMGAPMTGNPDRDFVAMMMPHHQGAIDMARLYLRDGHDPKMRALAERIVADQTREIAEMTAWQTQAK